MYRIPSNENITKCTVTKEFVNGEADALLEYKESDEKKDNKTA